MELLLPALLVDRLFELLARLEADALARLDVDRLAGRRVPALARGTFGPREAPEAGDLGGVAGLEPLRDGVEHRLEGDGRLPLGQTVDGIHNAVDEVSLSSHALLLFPRLGFAPK